MKDRCARSSMHCMLRLGNKFSGAEREGKANGGFSGWRLQNGRSDTSAALLRGAAFDHVLVKTKPSD